MSEWMISNFIYPTWSQTTSGSFSSIETIGKMLKIRYKFWLICFSYEFHYTILKSSNSGFP